MEKVYWATIVTATILEYVFYLFPAIEVYYVNEEVYNHYDRPTQFNILGTLLSIDAMLSPNYHMVKS